MIEVIDKPTQRRKLKITDPIGLHARPATLFCNLANKIKDAEVEIVKDDRHVNAKSILGVMSLGVKQNEEIELWIQAHENNDNAYDYVEDAINDIVETLINENIVEEIDMSMTNIDDEINASYDYLKRFETDEFVKIISGTIKKICELDCLDYYEIIEKIKNS